MKAALVSVCYPANKNCEGSLDVGLLPSKTKTVKTALCQSLTQQNKDGEGSLDVSLCSVSFVSCGAQTLRTAQQAEHDDNESDEVEEDNDTHWQREGIVEGVKVHPAADNKSTP